MANQRTLLESLAETTLARIQLPTSDEIREVIAQLQALPGCSATPDEAEDLAKDFERRHSVLMNIGAVIQDKGFHPWLEDSQASIVPYYWNRYKTLLSERRFTGQVITATDEVTGRVLGLLENPLKAGKWDRRGMVVGHVQSGKTANYIGLICKAADAGYKLIIVIAGVHNNLRNQTQLRIDEGFVGRDSARLLSGRPERYVGVGNFDKTRRPVTFTNSVRDFNKDLATIVAVPLRDMTEPAILVIKKNASTLKYVLDWLKEHNSRQGARTIDVPMLLIDDEADNASINTKYGKEQASAINAQIRNLLGLFDRSAYVGYTATPFANIFIDPDTDDAMLGQDLFPRNFIVSLDPPSNYFGAMRVFVDDSDSIIRHIADHNDSLPLTHKGNVYIESIPASLMKAIRTYVIARAIRLARGERNFHSSMLVNASRFTAVQHQIRDRIHVYVNTLVETIRLCGGMPDYMDTDVMKTLHMTYVEEYSECGIEWNNIRALLLDAAAPIKTVEVNSRSAGTLNYRDYEESGLHVIAVGGYSLSRGLTLEGLMCSYFLRNSVMYDTLMQMGRWFGYRGGYDDLCRIWMPESAEGWYRDITEAIEIMRNEFRSMEASGATPEEFGLKVRAHPASLIVTARNKMGSGQKITVNIGLANSFVETAILKCDQRSASANRRLASDLLGNMAGAGIPLSSGKAVTGGILYTGVPADLILTLISSFQNHVGSLLTEPGPICRYIEERQTGELKKWDVLIAGTSKKDADTLVYKSLGVPVNCQERSAGDKSNDRTLLVGNKQRVSSRGVEKTGLSDADMRRAEELYQEHNKQGPSGKRNANFPDWIYRGVRETPLLIIHLLKIINRPDNAHFDNPILAWSISFPRTKLYDAKVTYVVNTTWLRENYKDEIEEDEIDEDLD